MLFVPLSLFASVVSGKWSIFGISVVKDGEKLSVALGPVCSLRVPFCILELFSS